MSCQCTYNHKFRVLSQMWVPVQGAIPSLVTVSWKRFIWNDTWNDLAEEWAGRCPWEAVTVTYPEELWQMGQDHTAEPSSSNRLSRTNLKQIYLPGPCNRLNPQECTVLLQKYTFSVILYIQSCQNYTFYKNRGRYKSGSSWCHSGNNPYKFMAQNSYFT